MFYNSLEDGSVPHDICHAYIRISFTSHRSQTSLYSEVSGAPPQSSVEKNHDDGFLEQKEAALLPANRKTAKRGTETPCHKGKTQGEKTSFGQSLNQVVWRFIRFLTLSAMQISRKKVTMPPGPIHTSSSIWRWG